MMSRVVLMGLCTFAAAAAVAGVAFSWIEAKPAIGADAQGQRLASLPSRQAKPVPAVTFERTESSILELMSRSPFDEARRPFERTVAEPAPPPPPPRLLGISAANGERSALVEWRPTGEIQRLTVGMETPQGKVVSIGDGDLTLKSDAAEIKVSMFE